MATLDSQRLYVAAEPEDRKKVIVLGDPVFYGEPGVTTLDNDGQLDHGSVLVLAHGRTFISSGTSDVGVTDTDDKAEVEAPVEKKPAAKKAAPKKKTAKK